MKPQTVNALVMLLNSLLADLRWEEQYGAKLRDEQFEREVQEMREAVSGYREILIANGLLKPSSPSSQTH